MNWKRILIYFGLVFLGTFIGGGVVGFIQGYISATGQPNPQWLHLLQDVLVGGAIFIVFIRLGRQQRVKPWQHAIVVWIAASTLSLLNVFLGEPVLLFVISVVMFALIAAAGIALGLRLKPLPVREVEQEAT